MDRDTLLSILHHHLADLRRRGVKALVLFGPVARNEGRPGSEVDFLMELEPPHSFDQFLEIKLFLEALLERPVELVMGSPQHPEIQPYIEGDAIQIV